MKIRAAIASLASYGCLMTACATPPPAPSLSPQAEIEAFMRAYTEVWNRHDAAAIARDFYRMGPTVEEQTATLERQFEGLRAQGYERSDIHAILGCMTGAETGWAGMRFTRLTTDGEPLPPVDRASSYELRKFDDGWRITRLMGADASQPLACPEGG